MSKRVTRYVTEAELAAAWESRSQGWKMHEEIRSIQIGNTILKSQFAPLPTIEAFVDRLRSIGYKRFPSGFGEAFQAIYGKAAVSKSYIAWGPQRVYGPWEEKLQAPPGLRQYDLVSAYGWAGMVNPLPEAKFARPVRGFWESYPRRGQRGIWFGTWKLPTGGIMPPHLRRAEETPVWVSHEELLRLDLIPKDVERGIIFEGWHDKVRVALERIADVFPEWKKKIYRSYWGLWSAPVGPVQSSHSSERQLPNPFRNPALAHFIDSRVRIRMAQVAHRASLVYVDAIVTNKKIRTGTAPGQWRAVPLGKAAIRFKAAAGQEG